MTSIGGMEGSDVDSKLLLHSLHQLPQRPPWFMGGLWNMYCFPRGQTALEFNGHKGRGPVRNISGPAQRV